MEENKIEAVDLGLVDEMLGYDPTEEPTSTFEEIPDGRYEGAISGARYTLTREKKLPLISLVVSVMSPEIGMRDIFVGYVLGGQMKKFNAKKLYHTVTTLGLNIKPEHFANTDILIGALEMLNGTPVILEKTTNDKGYAEYKLEKDDTFTITEEDLQTEPDIEFDKKEIGQVPLV